MSNEERNIINSQFGLNLAYFIGKHTPTTIGHKIALYIADFISARKRWKIVRTVTINQWVANGRDPDNLALEKLVHENFRNIAISVYDLYHNLGNPADSLRSIVPNPFALQLVRRPEFSERGFVLAGVHMSNFDMVFQMGGLAGVKALVITLSELNKAYQKQWELRKRTGLHFVTASIGSMKHAIEYLRKGGIVITAIDRPDENSSYRPKFFGHPAALPVHHVFLALKANVPIIVAAIFRDPDGMYHILFSDPIEMIAHPDRQTELILNAENVLHTGEDFIRRDTTQWSMTFPIWPDISRKLKETV